MTWERLRNCRDEKLRMSDFSQLSDVQSLMSESDKTDWTNYRQSLRDIPDQIANPEDVVWPTRPDEA